jgi:hypothetical protein
MRSDVRDLLRPWLGEDVAFLERLSDDELARLCDALRAARRAQAKALAVASDEAMRQMPAPLRSGIARLVGR